MKYTLNFPTAIDKVNPKDDNIDVCVSCYNGKQYTFVVATLKNVEKLLEDGVLNPNSRLLIVDELTIEKVKKVIDLIMENNAACCFYGEDLL